ncbi:UNVERIFIED_CONTAM: hypothetical protein Sangu_3184500 [Sesamum angustifolium]|uniref:Uncharacterized protein n=1 Tax=Sesamum angustifolium TaxID=2727405 RepID=A0AAW2JMN0_9LAMI
MDEGEDGDLVDGNHGAVSATPTDTTTEGGAMMEDETEHGELENEGHGVGLQTPFDGRRGFDDEEAQSRV